MGSPSRNVQYHPPRLSEDRLNLPQPHSPSLPTHCSGKSGMRPSSPSKPRRPSAAETSIAGQARRPGAELAVGGATRFHTLDLDAREARTERAGRRMVDESFASGEIPDSASENARAVAGRAARDAVSIDAVSPPRPTTTRRPPPARHCGRGAGAEYGPPPRRCRRRRRQRGARSRPVRSRCVRSRRA